MRVRDRVAAFAIAVAVAALGGAAGADASPAHAATTAPQLILTASPSTPHVTLSPGDSAYWRVTAKLVGIDAAKITLQAEQSGALAKHPHGLHMNVQQCDYAWSTEHTPRCPGGARQVADVAPAQAGKIVSANFAFRPLRPGTPENLLVTLTIPDTAAAEGDASLMGLSANFGIGITATTWTGAPLPVGDTGGPGANGGASGSGADGAGNGTGADGAGGGSGGSGSGTGTGADLAGAGAGSGLAGFLARTGRDLPRYAIFAGALAVLLGVGFVLTPRRRGRDDAN